MNTQNSLYGHQAFYRGQYPQEQGPQGSLLGQMAREQLFYGYGSAPGAYQSQPPTYMNQHPHPPAGQQFPGQQQVPGYRHNNQSSQYIQHYVHQPLQQHGYQPYGAARRIANLHIRISYPLYEGQPPPQYHRSPGRQPSSHNIRPTPASPGYDIAQKAMVRSRYTLDNAQALRFALPRTAGCDERALVRIFANPEYRHPYAFQCLRDKYEGWYMRDLEEDIKEKTRGDFQNALVALARGPLDHDVYTLDKALNAEFIDEEALMDVLLCRSNADILAITSQYRNTKGKDLLDLLDSIKHKADDTFFHLYCNVISATRAEDAAPVDPVEIDCKTTVLYHTIGTNAIAVIDNFSRANSTQLRAMSIFYQQIYHRSLKEVIETEFIGDAKDALLRILTSATAVGGKAEADALREPLRAALENKRAITYRVLRLHWGDRAKLNAAQTAHRKLYHKTLAMELKDLLSGDYGDLMSALVGGCV